MARIGPVVASVVGWTVGAAIAVSVGMVALNLVGNDLTDDPLGTRGVDTVTPASATPTAATGPTTTRTARPTTTAAATSSPPASSQRTVTSAGGTVVVSCRPGGAYLMYWSPAPGFRAEDVVRGPTAVAGLTFETSGREVKITVRCDGGVPRPTTREDD